MPQYTSGRSATRTPRAAALTVGKPLERHIADLLEVSPVLEPLDVTLMEALGSVLAEDLTTDRPWPHITTAEIDGYAARLVDVRAGSRLEVIGDLEAGSGATSAVGPGKAIKVDAGTLLPAVADLVLPSDAVVVLDDASVRVERCVPSGMGVQSAGAISPEGRKLVPAGSVVDERLVAVLASLGRSRVGVVPRPRVVIVTVGSGLALNGTSPDSGLRYDATNIMLASATAAGNGLPYRVGPTTEEESEVSETLDDQLVRADLIVVAGGVESRQSPVREVLPRLGEVTFDEGSTGLGVFGTGTLGQEKTPIVSLPADPVAAFMLFRILVDPLLASLQGQQQRPLSRINLAEDVARLPGQTRILLAKIDDSHHAIPISRVRPTALELLSADAMIQILPGSGVQKRGSAVAAQLLEAK